MDEYILLFMGLCYLWYLFEIKIDYIFPFIIVFIVYQYYKQNNTNRSSDTNEDLPIVDKQFILDVLKTIGKSETNRGKQKTEDKIINKDTKDSLKIFYDNVFSKIIPEAVETNNEVNPSMINKKNIILTAIRNTNLPSPTTSPTATQNFITKMACCRKKACGKITNG